MNENTYLFKFLIALDIFVSALTFRDVSVTISAMTGLERRKPKPRWWARWMPLTTNHCNLAIQGDIERAQAALKLLQG
jgi:hypothetical protein